MKLTRLFLLALSVSLFVSCSNDDDSDNPKGVYDNGIFILNEGNSTDGGSVSFISDDLNTFNKDVYKTVNTTDFVGKFLQNIFFDGDKAYIIAGGSNVINVVDRYSFKLLAKVETGLNAPRYGVVKDGKAYVTNANTYWSKTNPAGNTDDFIAVINLATNKVETTIPLNTTANHIELHNNKLYVTEPYNSDKLLVVNPATNKLETSLTIGFGADTMEEKDGILYAIRSSYGERSEIVKVKLSDNSITKITFPESLDGVKNLDIYNNKIYYTLNTAVYAIDYTATTASTTPIFQYTSTSDYGKMYGFTVKDDRIFIADGGDFKSNSKAYIYNLSGTLQKELTVGVGPNGFYFND
ncbi:YncE family protein [Flavobacterium collinsii]|jgi:hypothetical protein|uniref:Surface layer protein n=1 Tax=Flavobacterium collinsii TaxID=1114861 RepID=A0ABM8KN47_9FLAO|nr:DUF5074 domain-containing protein [Flavobacterium collinsii]CAA9201380.1 hypothetical protein FLACOL7796_03707 [Flavobacterium collinsii]